MHEYVGWRRDTFLHPISFASVFDLFSSSFPGSFIVFVLPSLLRSLPSSSRPSLPYYLLPSFSFLSTTVSAHQAVLITALWGNLHCVQCLLAHEAHLQKLLEPALVGTPGGGPRKALCQLSWLKGVQVIYCQWGSRNSNPRLVNSRSYALLSTCAKLSRVHIQGMLTTCQPRQTLACFPLRTAILDGPSDPTACAGRTSQSH